MSDPMNVLDARNQLSKLVAAAEAGTDTVIARRGRPVARITGIENGAAHSASRLVRWLADNPLPEAIKRAPSDLDAQIAAEREGWE